MTPLLGFTPDAPTTTPGVITDCSNFIPYEAGMEGAPTAVSIGANNLAASAVQAATLTNLAGTAKTFAASATKIYELSGTSWTDRSAGGGSYTSTTSWAFAQFGDVHLAASPNNTLQAATSGAFAAVSGAPQARVLFVVQAGGGGFVFACNTNSFVDQWACSGLNDHTTWTPSVATQANAGRLLGNDNGAITAGLEFGDRALIFKRDAMFLGEYVGVPEVWRFQEVPVKAGCVGKDAACPVDQGVFFVGPDNFWLFDGARPIPVADGQVRQWFYNNVNLAFIQNTRALYNREKNRVFIFYPSVSSSGSLDAGLCWHLTTKQWGRVSYGTIQTAFVYISPGLTVDGLGSGQIDALVGAIDSQVAAQARFVAVFNGSNTLQTLSGVPGATSFTSEDVGIEDAESHLTETRLRYQTIPTTATATGYTLDEAGDSLDASGTIASSDTPTNARNKFDLRQCGKFHRIKYDFTGQVRVNAKDQTLIQAGSR
jgi:hypothetical protein